MKSKVARWLRNALRHRKSSTLKVVRCEEVERGLRDGTLYILGEGTHSWFAVMACPCKCGGTLHVSLLPDAEPRWTVIEHDDGTVSLSPSLWRRDGCRSHFMIRRSRVEWCGARGGRDPARRRKWSTSTKR